MNGLSFRTLGTTNEQERNHWVESALAALPQGWRLLDAGAGEGRYRPHCSHLDYVSQDFAQYDGQGNASGLQMGEWDTSRIQLVCDITDIPEPDSCFDAILCTEVFEHLPDPKAAINEFARLLRPGGILIVTAPFCSLTHFAPYHFSTGFNRYFYENCLPTAGFAIEELTPNGNFFQFLAQELRRISWVAEQYAGGRPGIIIRLVAQLMLLLLVRLARKDRGSSELLCFGWHVRAVRR